MSDPIVFIPGLLCTEALFAPQIAAFADRPILIANNREDDSIDGIASRLLEDAPDRFSLIGLSMGGYVAMEILRAAPGRVGKLALLNTSARADTQEQKNRRRALIRIARQGRFNTISDLFFSGFVHERNQADERLKSTVTEMALETGADAFIRQQSANAARIDSRPFLRDISCPVLVLTGDGDRLIAPAHSEEIHRLVPDSDFKVIDGCGHLSTLEDPWKVTAELREFLNRT